MTENIVVLNTCETEADAERIARALVETRLAACVSVVPGLRSFYHWQGALEASTECMLVIKTSRALFPALQLEIEKLHPYAVPELLALPVVAGSENYLRWLNAGLRGAEDSGPVARACPRGAYRMIALIFDMDGVIVDSNPLHRESWVAFNRRYGLETTEAMHESMYGKRNDEIVRNFFGGHLADAEIEARGRAKEQLYREMITGRTESMLVPGLTDFLERHRGLPMAVGSNAEPENIALVLEETGLRRYFPVVVDGHQVNRPKPYPDVYLRAAELLGIEPAKCVVFEDSYSGVAAGLAAGMPVIGISTTYVNLPGTSLTIDNFSSGDLDSWLLSQMRSV